MAIDPVRPTDDTARVLARGILRTARSGAIATLDAQGWPAASLVLVATDIDGTPLTLVSALSAHSANLARQPRASLLLSRPGKGDPLAHPRLALQVRAVTVPRESDAGLRARRRLLARHPKSALYIDFPDFSLVCLQVERASLNGGFGKAYELTAGDIVADWRDIGDLAAIEADVLAHMNTDHPAAVENYATTLLDGPAGAWRMTGLDADGCDLALGDAMLRLDFPEPVRDAAGVHRSLTALAARARRGLTTV